MLNACAYSTQSFPGDVAAVACLTHAPLFLCLVEKPMSAHAWRAREAWLLDHKAPGEKDPLAGCQPGVASTSSSTPASPSKAGPSAPPHRCNNPKHPV